MKLENIINQCKFLLHHAPEANETFNYVSERLNSESQDKFSFGYFPPSKHINLLNDLVGEDTLKELKLIYNKELSYGTETHNVTFSYFEDYPMVLPYKDAYGNIIGIIGRSILSEQERRNKKIPKYKNTSFNKGNYLFGLNEAKSSILSLGFVYLVEGQFDVIKAHEKGLTNIVALGNSNMTLYQASLIARYTDTVFLLLDNDEAGDKGRKKIKEKFGKYLSVNDFYLPEGYKDIDEYLTQNSLDSMSLLC